jgi:WD40 repeat protein
VRMRTRPAMKKRNQRRNRFALTVLVFACLCSASSRAPSRSSAQTITRPELVIQTGHSSRINCAVFAPDSRWLASGGADNSIRLWDVDSGLELRTLMGHQNWVRSLAVNSNGDLLASGSNDRTIKLWSVSSGRETLTLTGHQGAVDAVLFSPDGRWIISGSSDNTVRVWDANSGQQLQTLKGHAAGITALAISPDGKTLASGSAEGTIRLWNTLDWVLQRTLNKHTKKITTLSFSPDNRSLVSGSAVGELVLWDAVNGKARLAMPQAPAAVLATTFIGESAVLSMSAGGTIVTWDATTGKQKNEFASKTDAPEMLFASFSKDGKLVASSIGNRTAEVRKVADGKLARTLASHSASFFAVAFSRDGRWLASAANDRSIRLWQIATGREMPKLSGHTGWAQAVAFSPDSRQLASGSNSGEVKLWDVNSGRETYSQSYAGDRIHAIAFSADGKWLAAGGTSQSIYLLDLSTRNSRKLVGHQGEITSLAFVPRSSLIASGSTDKTIRLWDLSSGSPVKTFLSLNDQVNAIAVSPDGSMLAAGTADHKVELFKLNAGEPNARRTLDGHSGEIFTLVFSRDGRWLASAGADQTVRIWDPGTGNEVRTLTGASGEINGIDFSNDSRFIASANEDGSMILWNTETAAVNAVMVSIPEKDDWLVVTPSGLFDGSHAAWKLLLWRFAQSTFKFAPVESFFNEFYYPGLLADVLADKNPKPKQNIVNQDRRQPRVNVQTDNSSAAIANRTIQLKLEIAESPPEDEHAEGSGARDLRLFRNGLLVRVWPGDVLQGASKRTIETSLPVVAGENEFTAYAFNRDNVKSADSVLSISGAETLRRDGTAYLFVVGVSKYVNSQYNLNYSVADATEVAAQLKSQQELLRRYHPIEVISLLNEDATKENILLALKLLTGSMKSPLPRDAAADLSKIKPAQPEDAVVFYFSGHGTAQGDRFYLIPHDLGYMGPRSQLDQVGLATILSHSVSDLELEEALRPLDVDQLLLVIDACNSGQALQASEERRGPMNTRGLAQLAYEKGMYVLTASQSDEVAFESAGLKHSYLAYALVEEGIKSGAADTDANGQIFLNEWFNYATDRVPRIRGQRQAGGKQLEEVDEDEKRVQRPRVFNMREGGAERFVIARVAASAQSR